MADLSRSAQDSRLPKWKNEREAQCNVELMWLTRRVTPGLKTIANFRKDNGKAIRYVCRQFVVLCRQLDLFSDALTAIAERGYFKGEEILACKQAGSTVLVPATKTLNAKAHSRCDKADFIYDRRSRFAKLV